MRKLILLTIFITVLLSYSALPNDYFTIDKGPLYIQNSSGRGVKRYLPNIIISFHYFDTEGKEFKNVLLRTNDVGNIIDGKLPVSPGSKIKGSVEVKYTLADYTKSVYDISGALITNTGIKIEASSLGHEGSGLAF